MNTNTNITIVIIGSLALIAYLFYAAPTLAPGLLPVVLVGVGTLIKQFDSDKKAADTNAKVAEVKADQAITNKQVARSIDVSIGNQHSIAAISQQTNQGLEGVNQKVDGHLTSLLDEIRTLTAKVASLEQDKAVKIVEAAHAESSEQRIIAAVEKAAP